ncbi:MAG: hypothetical protein JNM63_17705 [Spirochaetia bacterium]|nr:hypothetical protein [Spirochaetia bacterium]
MLMTGTLIGWAFALMAWKRGHTTLAWADLFLGAVVAALVIDFRFRKKYFFVAYGAILLTDAFLLFLAVRGGEFSHPLWLYVIPPLSIFLLGRVAGLLISLLSLIAVTGFFLIPGATVFPFPWHFVSRYLASYLVVAMFSFIFETIRLGTQGALEKVNEHLQAAKEQTDLIFSNVNDGLFLLDRAGLIQPEYSRALEGILSRQNLGGVSFSGLLEDRIPPKALSGIRDFLSLAFKPDISDELLAELNPIEELILPPGKGGAGEIRHLRFQFIRVRPGRDITRLFARVHDATEETKLREQVRFHEEENRNRTTLLSEIITLPPKSLREFQTDAEGDLERLGEVIRAGNPAREIFPRVFQILHGMKGDALLLGLKSLAEKLHQEEGFLVSKTAPDTADFEGILRRLRENFSELKNILAMLANFQSDRAEEEASLSRFMAAYVEGECARSGKKIRLIIGETLMPETHRKTLKDILMQLVRNSLSHGIELPELRKKSGKEEAGKIEWSWEISERKLRLRYADDGVGLDPEKLLPQAVGFGLVGPEEVKDWSESRSLGIIFQPGFTTVKSGDLHAGRGMGMGLIRELVEKAGGSFVIRSVPGKSFEMDFEFPLP